MYTISTCENADSGWYEWKKCEESGVRANGWVFCHSLFIICIWYLLHTRIYIFTYLPYGCAYVGDVGTVRV